MFSLNYKLILANVIHALFLCIYLSGLEPGYHIPCNFPIPHTIPGTRNILIVCGINSSVFFLIFKFVENILLKLAHSCTSKNDKFAITKSHCNLQQRQSKLILFFPSLPKYCLLNQGLW